MNSTSLRGLIRAAAAVATVVAAVGPLVAPARGETDPAVAPATATAPVNADDAAGTKVRFTQQPTQAGDRVVQRLGAELTVATRIVQSGQVANESTSAMRRQQQRTIDVLEAAGGRLTRGRVTFEVSRRQSPEDANPQELAHQPIEGKTYLMHRTADRLSITDAAGAIPPMDQYKLVAESLDSVGKPNPLAEILSGRSLAVGERLLVPRDMARSILGLGEQLGEVRKFELALVRLDEPTAPGKPTDDAAGTSEAVRAIFKSHIEVEPGDASPLAVTLDGEIAVDPATCRLLAIDLGGPVTMSSVERTGGGIYQYSAHGQLKMAVRSQFSRPAP